MDAAKPSGGLVLDERAWCLLCARLKMSPREVQIGGGIFADQKEAAIAAELGMSPHTVRTHMERLYRKLGVRSRVEFVLRVVEQYVQVASEPGSELPPICGECMAGRCPLRRRQANVRLSGRGPRE
jgi:hypothetical protein